MHIIAFVIVSWSKHSQSRCITTFFVILFFYFLTNLLFEQDSNDGQIHACSFESCVNVKGLEGNIVWLSSPLQQLVRKAGQFCLLFKRASCMPVSLCRTWTTGQQLGKIDLQVGVTMRINWLAQRKTESDYAPRNRIPLHPRNSASTKRDKITWLGTTRTTQGRFNSESCQWNNCSTEPAGQG